MADLATANYLKENVGGALTKAMAALSVAQPNDAVDFLGRWLLQYAAVEEAREEQKKATEKLAAERAAKRQEEADAKAEAEKRAQVAQTLVKKREDLMGELGGATQWQEGFWQRIVDVSLETAEAKAAYLGVLEGEDDGAEGAAGPALRYTHTTPGSEFMLESTLPAGEGVTHQIFTKKDAPAPDGEGAEGAVPADFREYDAAYVEDVTDVPEVVYFDLTRIGSYLAVPLVYDTYLTEEALAEAEKYHTSKAEIEKENEAIRAMEPGEDGTKPEEKPIPPLALPGKSVKMAVCLDTLTGGRLVTPMKAGCKDLLHALCDSAGKAKSQCEMDAISEQAQKMLEEGRKEAKEAKLAQVTEAAEAESAPALTAKLEELGEEAKDEEKQIAELEANFEKRKKVLQGMEEDILELATYVIVDSDCLPVITALLLVCGFKQDQLYKKDKKPIDGVKSMSWPLCQKLLNSAFFEKLKTLDIKGPRKGLKTAEKVEFWKSNVIPADMNEEKSLSTRPGAVIKALLLFVQDAVALRAFDVKTRREAHQAKMEEGAEGEVEPFGDVDDDFVD